MLRKECDVADISTPVWSAPTTRQTFDDIQTFGNGNWIYQQNVCKNKGEAASRLAAENQQHDSWIRADRQCKFLPTSTKISFGTLKSVSFNLQSCKVKLLYVFVYITLAQLPKNRTIDKMADISVSSQEN